MWRHPRSQLLRSRGDSSSLCFQSNASGGSEFTSFLLSCSGWEATTPVWTAILKYEEQVWQSGQQRLLLRAFLSAGSLSLSLLLLHSVLYPVTHFFWPQHQSLKCSWILWLSKSMLGKMLKKNHSNYTLRFRKRCSYQHDLKFGNLNKSQ